MVASLAPLEVIERSRRGDPVDAASVESFVGSWLDGTADDAQMAAWCMAACLRGLPRPGVEGLTRALIASGQRLELASLAPTGDIHSTGGVGDSVPLVAAPLAASLGVRVATMSSRGQAHAGGTIDKLEAIPGYEADLPLNRFVRQVRDAGIAVVSHASSLTPGEERLFAPAGRHRHGSLRGPHRGLDHEQEARRRGRGHRARRQGGERRVLPRRGQRPRGRGADGEPAPSPGAARCAGW